MLKIAILTSDGREIRGDYTPERPDFGTAISALLQGFEGIPDLEVHVLSCTRGQVARQHKLADNITFHSLHVPRLGWMRTGYQGCIRAVRKKLKELQPDIVHGQGTERDCALSAVFSGFPNVLTIHGNMRLIAEINRPRPFTYPWIAARLETFTLPRSDGVVCITHYTQAAVAPLARRTWLLPNAIDGRFFKVQTHPAPDEPPVIFCVGAVCLRKNQNAFIRALDPLAQKKPFKIFFIGHAAKDDPYGREFFDLLASRPWCRHSTFESQESIRNLFLNATMLALPSLEDNCPMAVLEAMASGVPVMAANVGGVPDLIEQNRTGLLCDPLDAQSMAEAVERLLQDQALSRRLATEARAEALKRFYPPVVAQRHVEIYQEALRTAS